MRPSCVLVVYFSRTGTTRAVAQAIHGELHCDVERICERPRDTGVLGYARARFDALLDRPAELEPMRSSFCDYDLVVIGAPVLDGVVPTPIRTFLERYGPHLKRVAFFCTYAGHGSTKAFQTMTTLAGQAPLLTLDVRSHEATTTAILHKVRTFGCAIWGLITPRNPCVFAQDLQDEPELALVR